MEAVENLKEKQRAHEEIAKKLEEAEAAMNKLSEKEKIIQEQAKQIEEKEEKGRIFLADTENLKESERSQAEMAKKLKELTLRHQ